MIVAAAHEEYAQELTYYVLALGEYPAIAAILSSPPSYHGVLAAGISGVSQPLSHLLALPSEAVGDLHRCVE
jgi:hypothetical protein